MSAAGEAYNATNASLVYDYSGLGNHGSNIGATYNASDGRFSGAFEFDGVDDYVLAHYNPGSTEIDKLTVMAWIYLRGKTNTAYDLLNHGKFDQDAHDWRLRYSWSDLLFVFSNSTHNFTVSTTPDDPLSSQNRWYFVAATFDNGNVNLYVDGVLKKSQDNSANISYGGNSNLYIGRYASTGYHWNGSIDSVRIYNRSLSAEEIRLSMGSSLKQRNSTHWEFYSNITGLSATSYKYSTCANDTVGNSDQSGIRTLDIHLNPILQFQGKLPLTTLISSRTTSR